MPCNCIIRDDNACTRHQRKGAGPYVKGDLPTLETAWEGEPSSPGTNMDSSFSPALPVLSLGCWPSAKTGFTSLCFIIKLH